MQGQSTASEQLEQGSELVESAGGLREVALRSALAKRAAGVPTYSVPKVAALFSVSPDHVYRLIQADSFPVVQIALSGRQGRYVVPAAVAERLLGEVAAGSSIVDIATWTAAYQAEHAGGAA